ncbi:hypothetical protein HOY80DRAFT_1140335 [Tuber brumale]|nr:hypothetical protein HOY80DRAFT_1140335 [Tuber brumale]
MCVPPETKPSHFDSVLHLYAEKHGLSIDGLVIAYNDGRIKEHKLDRYFLNDLSCACADLVTVDLNSLLYKYEVDIAMIVKKNISVIPLAIPRECYVKGFSDLKIGIVQRPSTWERRGRNHQIRINIFSLSYEKGHRRYVSSRFSRGPTASKEKLP